MRKFGLLTVAALLLLLAVAQTWIRVGAANLPQFKLEPVRRDDITVTVSVTGKLEPVNQLDVGAELSGTIKTVAVDYNDWVKAGQVLARLDTDLLEAKVRQSQAALELAQARVEEADATLTEMRNRWRRTGELARKNLTSAESLDAAEAAYARAQATLTLNRAQVKQAQAQLDFDRTTLQKAVIHSPIDGIVLKRLVKAGQTVAATLQTPVLFTLAENLTQMELHVDVDEADVAQVKEGQQATFTVDAYPNRRFPAKVTEVRYAPQVSEGVVSYETVLSIDNSALLLRPGMTATGDITVGVVRDAVLVPNAALRFTPPATGRARGGGLLQSLLPSPPRQSSKNQELDSKQKRVWRLQDGAPVAIPVEVGESDGRMTVIVAGAVQPGMSLLVDTVSAGK